MRASASASSTSWVRPGDRGDHPRAERARHMQRAATRGRRSRSATAIRICLEARRCPTVMAAATPAAAEAQPSNAQFARSSSSTTRRRASSATAASRRAPAAASARVPPRWRRRPSRHPPSRTPSRTHLRLCHRGTDVRESYPQSRIHPQMQSLNTWPTRAPGINRAEACLSRE